MARRAKTTTSSTSGAVETNMGYTTLAAGSRLRDGTLVPAQTYVTFLRLADGSRQIVTPDTYKGKLLP